MKREIRRAVSATLESEGMDKPCIVHVSFVTKGEIMRLNRKYMNKNKVTDVLSFPALADLEDISPFDYEYVTEGSRTVRLLGLGDVILYEKAIERHAEEFKDIFGKGIVNSFENELIYMVIHSVLHLLGYDHVTSPEDERIMTDKQDAVFYKLKAKSL